MEQVTDHDLMIRVRGGDHEAYAILVGRYWSPLGRYAASVLGADDEAKDVAQEVFVRLWRSRSGWTPSGSVSAYLYRTARNLALNAVRDERAEKTRREREARAHPPVRPRTPEQDLEEGDLRADVDAAIAALPRRRREVFVLSRFHGLTHREIGETMGVSPQTVANQMSAALEQLRDTLSAHLDQS